MEIETPRTLLVLKPSSFGDIIHTLPAVARLKAAWPACRVSWLANTEWMPLLAGNQELDEVVEFPRADFRGWAGGWKMAQWLRKRVAGLRPDLALDFQGLLRTAVIGRASRPGALQGLSDAREGARFLYHRTVAAPAQPVHAVRRYLALADAVLAAHGGGHDAGGKTSVSFSIAHGVPPAFERKLAADFILIHPFARGKGKSFNVNSLSDLLRKISGRQMVLVGRRNGADYTGANDCLDLLGKTTLPELIWLTRRASFVVSVDSGPAHLAAALNRPMVAIHAWSDPRKVGPFRSDAWVWKNGILTRVSGLAEMPASFFEPRPLKLREGDLDSIARLAISPSNSSA